MTSYFAIATTHNYAREGGRKVHIGTEKGSLCGIPERHEMLMQVTPITMPINEWISSDADDELCKVCRRKAQTAAER